MFKLYFTTLLLFVSILWSNAQTEATLLGVWDDPSLIGSNAHDNTYNEIWGVAINGAEYGIIGSTAGTHFIDVSTNPSQPYEAFFIKGAISNGQIIHRDYHDYKGFLYAVADEGSSTMQIIDMRCMPEEIKVIYDDDELIKRAHNIFIDDEKGLLYAFATRNGANQSHALRIYDLSDPTNPEYMVQHRNFGGINVGHVHDGWVNDGLAFLNCGGDGMFIVDFTDPFNPVTLDELIDYPDQGYNHSGWPSTNLDYYYLADENHGFDVKVVDISKLDSIFVEGTFNSGEQNPSSIPHNQVVHCNYLYISYYFEGLQVFDISNPAEPERVLQYDTYSLANSNQYKGAWGVYPFLPSGKILTSDMQSGLYVFEAIDSECAGREISVEIADECVLTPTALFESTNQLSNIYPNPSKVGGAIHIDSKSKIEFIELINTNGQQIQSWAIEKVNQSIVLLDQNVSTGYYLLKIIMEDGNYEIMPLNIH